MAKIRPFLSAATIYIYNDFVTHWPSFSIRHLYLTRVLRIGLGKNSSVHMGCFFAGKQVEIGHNSVINRDCYLDGRVGVEIGDNVSVSPEVYIVSLTHDPQHSEFKTIGNKVILRDYVWVGARAMVLPGVVLSEGCVVGAGAVVTKSFESYSIVAGVPARKIGERSRNLNYSLRYFTYFDTDIQQ